MKYLLLTISISFSLLINSTQAEEPLNLKGATIIGNRELPKVLYIMPWKTASIGRKPEHPETAPPAVSLEPLDITSFRRKVLINSTGKGNVSN